MFLRSKAVFWVAAVLATCGWATKASAIGASYDFSANSSSQYWNFSAYSSTTGESYYLDPPFFEFDPSEKFRASNLSVSGQFSYDTEADVSYTTSRDNWDYTSYDSESFFLNFSDEGGQAGRFNFTQSNASLSTYTDPTRRYFFASGYQVEPSLTLTGTGESGGEGGELVFEDGFFVDLPVGQLQEDNPELFAGVENIEVAIFGFDTSSPYELSSANFGMRSNTLLPTNGVLPGALPTLSEADSSWLSLRFNPVDSQGFLGLDVVDISGDISQDQEDQINEFVQDLYVDLDLSIQYNVTDLTQLDAGVTPFNPILPEPGGSMEEGFDFTFEVPDDLGEFTFVDPFVAIGYDYEVTGDANFAGVLLPEDIGDNMYDLWLFDATLGDYVDSGIDLTGGVPYVFAAGGIDQFRILGIETSEFLDPDDATAFVTGLQFLTAGASTTILMSQTPLTEFVDVPSPSSGVLLLTSVVGLLFRRRNA